MVIGTSEERPGIRNGNALRSFLMDAFRFALSETLEHAWARAHPERSPAPPGGGGPGGGGVPSGLGGAAAHAAVGRAAVGGGAVACSSRVLAEAAVLSYATSRCWNLRSARLKLRASALHPVDARNAAIHCAEYLPECASGYIRLQTYL